MSDINGAAIICLGQQPGGFFPKRFLVAKIRTALRLQREIGGRVVLFYHDSDHDYRETVTTLADRTNGNLVRLNFRQENKIQKKFSPLYCKRIPADWQEEMARKLPTFVESELVGLFRAVEANTAADFCLSMYEKLGLLEDIEIVRSSQAKYREQAIDLSSGYFADVEYQGEIVRAQDRGPDPNHPDKRTLVLHEGGGRYLELPAQWVEKSQINPHRDQRLRWMQSVVHCTHYVMGMGEKTYLDPSQAPEITFLEREMIDREDEAWTETTLGD